jgi:hypothetical protein
VASSSSTSGGISFGGVLFVVFLILKLCHVISWSWWWVTAPLWVPFGLFVVIAGFCFIMAVFTGQVWRRKAFKN